MRRQASRFHRQRLDQGVEQHAAVPCRPSIFPVDMLHQCLQSVSGVGQCGDARAAPDPAGVRHDPLEVADQWCRQGQDVALDVRGEGKAVNGERRYQDQQRGGPSLPTVFQLQFDLARLQQQQVSQVDVAVGMDAPIVKPTAFGDGFAVQQVGGRPATGFPVKGKGGNR